LAKQGKIVRREAQTCTANPDLIDVMLVKDHADGRLCCPRQGELRHVHSSQSNGGGQFVLRY
jgi:hypothetical protein